MLLMKGKKTFMEAIYEGEVSGNISTITHSENCIVALE